MQPELPHQDLDNKISEKSSAQQTKIFLKRLIAILSVLVITFTVSLCFILVYKITNKNNNLQKNPALTTLDDVENKEINSDTLVELENGYSKDQYHVYYNKIPILKADPKTFVVSIIEGDELRPYGHDDSHIYEMGNYWDGDSDPEYNLDPRYFSPITNFVFKDDKKVVFKNFNYYIDKWEITTLTNVDAPSFKLVGECSSFYKNRKNYFIDKNNVYVENELIKADPKTFSLKGVYGYYGEGGGEFGGNIKYATDKNSVFIGCDEKLIGADPKSFRSLGQHYGKDKKNIWFKKTIVSGADLSTFKAYDTYSGYFYDINNVYYEGEVIKNADVESFEVLSYFYARDKNYVYSGGKVNKGADPKKCTKENLDLYHVYSEKNIENCGIAHRMY